MTQFKKIKDLNRHSTKNVQVASKHIERYLISFIFREKQIKTILWYFYYSVFLRVLIFVYDFFKSKLYSASLLSQVYNSIENILPSYRSLT